MARRVTDTDAETKGTMLVITVTAMNTDLGLLATTHTVIENMIIPGLIELGRVLRHHHHHRHYQNPSHNLR
ncbi:hypothetical protein EYB26_003313 [Talaromyces marneffei]|uniref:uncharacterized protein n=1 Tax=Talaromyces marneffei TaxID=37727 RepID=UPI0012A87276|nr:uncharacterized protein EYB26_003313 [Talaromyces marneffei]QGA15653.1 hypothetical protein EYB26_003313 [Talaromyces marneffei]